MFNKSHIYEFEYFAIWTLNKKTQKVAFHTRTWLYLETKQKKVLLWCCYIDRPNYSNND